MMLLLKKVYMYPISMVVIIFIMIIDTVATSRPGYKNLRPKGGNTYRHQTNRQIHQRDNSKNAHDPGVVARELGDRDHGVRLGGGAQGDFLEGEAVGVEDGVVALIEDSVELFFPACC